MRKEPVTDITLRRARIGGECSVKVDISVKHRVIHWLRFSGDGGGSGGGQMWKSHLGAKRVRERSYRKLGSVWNCCADREQRGSDDSEPLVWPSRTRTRSKRRSFTRGLELDSENERKMFQLYKGRRSAEENWSSHSNKNKINKIVF